jgi:hypothetical protein
VGHPKGGHPQEGHPLGGHPLGGHHLGKHPLGGALFTPLSFLFSRLRFIQFTERDSLTKICSAFIGTVGKLKLF